MTIDDIQNGLWWRAPYPACWIASTQWVDGDLWLLLGQEDRASHGGTCRIAFQTEIPGKGYVVLHTKEQLFYRLNTFGWRRTSRPGEMLISSVSDQISAAARDLQEAVDG